MNSEVTTITWSWGTNSEIDFNPQTDLLDFGWFAAGNFKLTEVNGSLVIAIPSNNQTYTLTDVGLSDLSINNIIAKDASALAAWKAALAGETDNGGDTGGEPDDSGGGNDDGEANDGPDNGGVEDGGVNDGAEGGPWFSPYIDMSLSTSQDVVNIASSAQLDAVTLAFLTTSGADQIGWGGAGDVENASLYNGSSMASVIADLQAMDVDVTVSFGGAVGAEAATTFTTVDSLVSAYQSVIDAYNVTNLDFDIEGAGLYDAAANALRNDALAQLQAANPNVEISFTLPALTTGLTSVGLDLLRSADAAGVEIDYVNIMAMNYGSYYDTGDMGDDAISAATATLAQFDQIGLDTQLVITPMIGVNDVATEIFTLEDAQQLVDFAASNDDVEGVSMWSLSRDNGDTVGALSPVGSGLVQDTYAFSEIFNTLSSSQSGGGDDGEPNGEDGASGNPGTDPETGGDDDNGAGAGETPTDDDGAVTQIVWKWGKNTVLDFDPATDMLDFGWFSASNVALSEEDGSVVIAIPSNNQSYTLAGVEFEDMSMDDISAKDPSMLAEWSAILG